MNRRRADANADQELRLHRLLSWQLRLLPLSLLGLGLMLVIGLLLGEIALLRAATAVLAGIPLGLILSRVQRVSWSPDAQLLTATIDALGVVMLLLLVVAHAPGALAPGRDRQPRGGGRDRHGHGQRYPHDAPV